MNYPKAIWEDASPKCLSPIVLHYKMQTCRMGLHHPILGWFLLGLYHSPIYRAAMIMTEPIPNQPVDHIYIYIYSLSNKAKVQYYKPQNFDTIPLAIEQNYGMVTMFKS